MHEAPIVTDPVLIAAIGVVFLLAGTVKGVIGLGLPTVSLGLLVLITDLPSAMALLLAPSFVTNVWQGAVGGHGLALLQRLWPFLLPAMLLVWLGAQALSIADLDLLSGLLGLLVVAYATCALVGLRPTLSPARERWAGVAFGTVNGVLTGMTGSFVVPGVIYLQALGLPRDQLVQAMGIAFTAATLALGFSIAGHPAVSRPLALVSAASVLPALLGMVLGRRLRRRLSEARFRQVFFWALLALGLVIVGRSAGATF